MGVGGGDIVAKKITLISCDGFVSKNKGRGDSIGIIKEKV